MVAASLWRDARAIAVVLHKWASLVAVRAIDAAVARFRFQYGMTARALIEEHTPIGGHRLRRDMRAYRTREGDIQIGHESAPISQMSDERGQGFAADVVLDPLGIRLRNRLGDANRDQKSHHRLMAIP